jgi:hypothetical protein
MVGRGWGWGMVRQIQWQFRKIEFAEAPPTPDPASPNGYAGTSPSPPLRTAVRGKDSSDSNDSSSQSRVESAKNFQRRLCCKHSLRLKKVFPGQPCTAARGGGEKSERQRLEKPAKYSSVTSAIFPPSPRRTRTALPSPRQINLIASRSSHQLQPNRNGHFEAPPLLFGLPTWGGILCTGRRAYEIELD